LKRLSQQQIEDFVKELIKREQYELLKLFCSTARLTNDQIVSLLVKNVDTVALRPPGKLDAWWKAIGNADAIATERLKRGIRLNNVEIVRANLDGFVGDRVFELSHLMKLGETRSQARCDIIQLLLTKVSNQEKLLLVWKCMEYAVDYSKMDHIEEWKSWIELDFELCLRDHPKVNDRLIRSTNAILSSRALRYSNDITRKVVLEECLKILSRFKADLNRPYLSGRCMHPLHTLYDVIEPGLKSLLAEYGGQPGPSLSNKNDSNSPATGAEKFYSALQSNRIGEIFDRNYKDCSRASFQSWVVSCMDLLPAEHRDQELGRLAHLWEFITLLAAGECWDSFDLLLRSCGKRPDTHRSYRRNAFPSMAQLLLGLAQNPHIVEEYESGNLQKEKLQR